jgi:hypothetical protein
MKQITCTKSVVCLEEDNVLYVDIQPEVSFELEDFLELKNAAKELGQGKKFYNLIHVGEFTIPNDAARTASTSHEGSTYKLADAFVIHSFSQKLVANFYLSYHKPVVPTRFFTCLKDAREWLYGIRKLESRVA